jgi:hypothetical protein
MTETRFKRLARILYAQPTYSANKIACLPEWDGAPPTAAQMARVKKWLAAKQARQTARDIRAREREGRREWWAENRGAIVLSGLYGFWFTACVAWYLRDGDWMPFLVALLPPVVVFGPALGTKFENMVERWKRHLAPAEKAAPQRDNSLVLFCLVLYLLTHGFVVVIFK